MHQKIEKFIANKFNYCCCAYLSMTKLVLYVYYSWVETIDGCGDNYGELYVSEQTLKLNHVSIISDEQILDKILLDKYTEINEYGEFLNFDVTFLRNVLINHQWNIDSFTIDYMKIEELKNISQVINKYIENKKKID